MLVTMISEVMGGIEQLWTIEQPGAAVETLKYILLDASDLFTKYQIVVSTIDLLVQPYITCACSPR